MPQQINQSFMKDDYSVGLRNGVNNNNVVWGEVARNTEDIVGFQAVWSVRSGRSGSSLARGELGTLATGDRQRYLRAVDDLAYVYHTIKISGPVKHLTKNDEGAFIRAVESEVKGAEADLKHMMSRQTFGQVATILNASNNGGLAQVASVSGATVTFTAATPKSVIRHFYVGQTVAFADDTTATWRTGIYEVQSLDVAAKTVTFTATVNAGVVANDWAVHSGEAANAAATVTTSQTNLGSEINGLRFLIGTQDYAGITAASNAVWNSLSLGSSSTAISEAILDEGVEKVEVEGNGSSPGLYLTEHAQRRKLASLLQAQKRYEGREMTLTSGWKGLNVARGTLVVDRFCPSDTVFCLDMKEIELFVGLDFQWDEDDGEVFFKTSNQDAIEARFKAYLNLEAVARNAHSKITLAEPTF